MRYYTKSKVFKSKRCLFDPYKMEAWSYDWWQFVAAIRGTVYFNAVGYSMQTGKQQAIVRNLLDVLEIKYKTVYIKCGLQNISQEIKNLNFEISQLELAIANPKSRSKTNKDRLHQIKRIENKILQLEKLNKLKNQKGKEYIPSYHLNRLLFAIAEKQRESGKAKRVSKLEDNTQVALKAVNSPSEAFHTPKVSLTCLDGGKALGGVSRANLTLVK